MGTNNETAALRHEWLLDDEITAIHHCEDEARDGVIVHREGQDEQVLLGAGAPGAADLLARRTVPEVEDTSLVEDARQALGNAFGRRTALRGMAAGFGSLLAPAALPRYAFGAAGTNGAKDTVVVIFLRGGMDGLHSVPPVGDPDYYRLRPKIGISQESAVPLDGIYGLHPSLSPLKKHYDAGTLALVHATGNTNPSRSHFDKQFLTELGAVDVQVKSGWLGRYLALSGGVDPVLRAVTIGPTGAVMLQQTQPTVSMTSMGAFSLARLSHLEQLDPRFQELDASWGHAGGPLGGAAMTTVSAMRTVASATATATTPENGAVYPRNSSFATNMRNTAQVIKADVGLEMACIDLGSWDWHHLIVNSRGLLEQLAGGLDAFITDLGPERMKNVTVITLTEFGRTAHQNGSEGTDHGLGNVMFVAGGGVNGGKVYGDWPGLADSQQDGGGLAISTDYRSILHELVSKRMAPVDMDVVLPGWSQGSSSLGLFKT